MAPVLYRVNYERGRWGESQILPYGPLELDPAAKALHYAQSIFEGLKAYFVETPTPVVFRPEMNWQRLNSSAHRMEMPELPENLFMEGLFAIAGLNSPLIPRQSRQSLYLRPLMYGTQQGIGLASSDTYTFMVIASPGEALTSQLLRVLVEREGSRAAVGGTGNVKVSGNYGASLRSTAAAIRCGFDQPLWLDALTHRYIEELSIMNFFAVIDDELHTPELSGTILPGVTRASIIELARADGIRVHERRMEIDELLSLINSGRCTEAFACGTAIVVCSISTIGDQDGQRYELKEPCGTVAERLKQKLLDIQEGRVADRLGWMCCVPAHYCPK
jgi:branched-chain amino acid aminotransferase